jgi:elongation factor G
MAMSSAISRAGGVINEETQRGNAKVLDCFIPLAEMFGYVTDLRSLTQGRGNFTMTFDHYGETPRYVQDRSSRTPTCRCANFLPIGKVLRSRNR